MKLVTWNIQWGRGADGRVDLDRIVAHARRFADFDVLCLQEVSAGYPELPGCDGSEQFVAIAARLPGYTRLDGVATDTPHPAGERRRFGNPALPPHAQRLDDGPELLARGREVVLAADVVDDTDALEGLEPLGQQRR